MFGVQRIRVWICRGLVVGAMIGVLLFVARSANWWFAAEEIESIPSPDGRVEAILVRIDPGAMNDFGYFVYIVPKGSREYRYPWPLSPDPILTGAYFENLKLAWKTDQVLDIQYSKANIYSFANFWFSRKVDNLKYVVEVRLKPTSEFPLHRERTG